MTSHDRPVTSRRYSRRGQGRGGLDPTRRTLNARLLGGPPWVAMHPGRTPAPRRVPTPPQYCPRPYVLTPRLSPGARRRPRYKPSRCVSDLGGWVFPRGGLSHPASPSRSLPDRWGPTRHTRHTRHNATRKPEPGERIRGPAHQNASTRPRAFFVAFARFF